MSTAKEIKYLIAQGRIEQAIQQMLKATETRQPDLHNELLAVSNRFQNLLRESRSGLISYSEKSMQSARIVSQLLEMVDELGQAKTLFTKPEPRELNTAQSSSAPMKSTNEVKTILFMGVNPRGKTHLRVDEEVREIEEGLTRSQKRAHFQLNTKLAVRASEIHRALLDTNPNIVHFSGHGGGPKGLAFEDKEGQAKMVSTEALAELFDIFSEKIECVILNACYSEDQGQAIQQYINYVIGMDEAIPDKSAIAFSIGFYDALGAGRDIETAFRLGKSNIRLQSLKGADMPQLLKR